MVKVYELEVLTRTWLFAVSTEMIGKSPGLLAKDSAELARETANPDFSGAI